jgi:RNA polymerase sigma-70 factor (ECF subfamily)
VDEGELIDRVVAGEALAERALYDAHVDRIYRIAFRFAGDDEAARDITQETFIRAFDRISTFRRESSVSTWLHSIAVSVALNQMRAAKRTRSREVTLDEGLAVPVRGRMAEPDLKSRLAEAIDALAPGYRSVFVLHDIEGLTHAEIGSLLGVDDGTSKAQLSHARKKLRAALADFAGEWLA